MNRIDKQRLISLRLSRGLAIRQLARDCGIEIAVLNRLETAPDPGISHISAAALARLADRLDVPVGYLFTDDLPTATSSPQPAHTADADDDARTLGALLNALNADFPATALADSLNWTITRVHDAADHLNQVLAPAGLTVLRSHGLVSIRPADDSHDTAELAARRHPRARTTQRLLTPARAKLLYRAAHTPISPHSLTTAARINIALLFKAGLLVEDEQRHLIPSPDVVDSLDPTRCHESVQLCPTSMASFGSP